MENNGEEKPIPPIEQNSTPIIQEKINQKWKPFLITIVLLVLITVSGIYIKSPKYKVLCGSIIPPSCYEYVCNGILVSGIGTHQCYFGKLQQIYPVASIPLVQSDETKDWKIYKNNTYKFSIQYPSEWNIISEFEDPFALTISNYTKSQYVHGLGVPDRGGLEVRIIEGVLPACRNINDNFILQVEETEIGLQPYEKLICDGLFTIILSYTDDAKNPLSSNEITGNKELLEKILSTFKFTK